MSITSCPAGLQSILLAEPHEGVSSKQGVARLLWYHICLTKLVSLQALAQVQSSVGQQSACRTPAQWHQRPGLVGRFCQAAAALPDSAHGCSPGVMSRYISGLNIIVWLARSRNDHLTPLMVSVQSWALCTLQAEQEQGYQALMHFKIDTVSASITGLHPGLLIEKSLSKGASQQDTFVMSGASGPLWAKLAWVIHCLPVPRAQSQALATGLSSTADNGRCPPQGHVRHARLKSALQVHGGFVQGQTCRHMRL